MLTPDIVRRAAATVRSVGTTQVMGRVQRVTGMLIEARIPGARIGDVIEIDRCHSAVIGEVVGLRDGLALVVPLSDVRGVESGARARRTGASADIPVSPALLGRVVDPFGRPIDGRGEMRIATHVPLDRAAPAVTSRVRIDRCFETGVRVIDALLTCGRGQRVGIFSGAGVGKTILLRQIAQLSDADITVVGLIGERGCEVQDLLASELGRRGVVVAATSDRSPMERARGALAATAIAEHFRDGGADVLLIIDSLTRYAMALREIGLAAAEPPATKGYPPSVFATMPRLLERVAPVAGGGAITGFYTVLVEGDDLADPVADAARSLLDGHLVLSREMAERGQFPAVDVLASASRVVRQITTPQEQSVMQRARAILATRREAAELRSLGAYVAGANPHYDQALVLGERIDRWGRQTPEERCDRATSVAQLGAIVGSGGGQDAQPPLARGDLR